MIATAEIPALAAELDDECEIRPCAYCAQDVLCDGDEFRDSHGEPTCERCYQDGTAYVEPLDFARDTWDR